MKKLLYLFSLFGLLSVSGLAQASVAPQTMTGSGDTITDTTPDFVVKQLQLCYEQVTVQAVVTKISGTVDGSIILYGSVDGTNYSAVGQDTATMTNVTTNKKEWTLTNTDYLYYKVVFTGIGTMSASVRGYIYPTGAAYSSHAATNLKSSTNNISDTIVNTATEYVGVQVQRWYNTTTIQAVVTKISGTAAGTVTLQGSLDGTNYSTVQTRVLTGTAAGSTTATLTVTNVATSQKIWVLTGSPYRYYRLSYTGSGTMSCTLKGYLLPNRK